MGRRASRDTAMKFLYQLEIQKEFCIESANFLLEEVSDRRLDKEYLKTTVKGVIQNVERIDKLIARNLVRWKIDRISKVDLSILRLAIFEILHMKEIPVSVSINEAVELAKKYSSDESASFINGLLSKVLQPERQENLK
jgi:N utilization substance protein B